MSSLTLEDLKRPTVVHDRVLISSMSWESLGIPTAIMCSGSNGSTAWPVANTALFVPLQIGRSILVTKMWGLWGAVGDNISFGLYKEDGAQLYGGAAVASANANTGQEVDVSPDVLLRGPARYYMGLSCAGTTLAPYRANFNSAPVIRAIGAFQMATAHPLSGITTATYAVNTSFITLPVFGIAGRTTVT